MSRLRILFWWGVCSLPAAVIFVTVFLLWLLVRLPIGWAGEASAALIAALILAAFMIPPMSFRIRERVDAYAEAVAQRFAKRHSHYVIAAAIGGAHFGFIVGAFAEGSVPFVVFALVTTPLSGALARAFVLAGPAMQCRALDPADVPRT